MDGDVTPVSATLTPATNFFSLGAELLSEVQRIIGTYRVRSLRIKFGDRVVKEIPIAPLTTVATIALVMGAVLISTMSIEVEHEPDPSAATEATPAGSVSEALH